MPVKNEKQVKNKTRYQAAQDLVPVEQIADGIIKLENGDYIKVMEVFPTNYRMMGKAEQRNTLAAFAGFLKISPVHLHFKMITRPANANEHIEFIRQQVKQLLDGNKEAYVYRDAAFHQYSDLTQRISRSTAVTRRFFIIFKYEYDAGFDYVDIVGSIRATEQQMREYLSSCGNVCAHYQSVDDENEAQAELYYTLFNRASEEKFRDHVKKVVETQMLAQGLVPELDPVPDISIKDIVAPRRVNLTHRNWIYMDGTFYAFLMIAADGYPTEVPGAWLDELVNLGAGVDIDIFADRQIKSDMQNKLNRTLAFTKSKAHETTEFSRNYESVKNALDAIRYIKDCLANSNEDFYYINTLITVYAPSAKELRRRLRRVEDLFRSRDMKPVDCTFRYEQAFQSSLPCAKIDPSLNQVSARNILTSGLASTYLFTAYELSHKHGVVLGVNPSNNSLFAPDIFDTSYFQNANMMITGSSGGGKTFTLGMLMTRFHLRGLPVYLIAPDKGHEFRRLCNQLGGAYVKFSGGSNFRINVMELHPYDDTADREIEGAQGAYQGCFLNDQVQSLKTWFSLLVPEISNRELQTLDAVIGDTYAQFGITKDNNSVFMDKHHEILREPPILGNLYTKMQGVHELDNVTAVLAPLISGSESNFNGHTNVDLRNRLMVFDITDLTGNLKPAGMYMLAQLILGIIKNDRTVNQVIMIDELWQLISRNHFAAEFALDIWKVIRGYGGAAVGATQDIEDFFKLDDGYYGKNIINNSSINILKKTKPIEAKIVRNTFDLTESEYNQIMRLSRSQGLFCTDISKMQIEFMPTLFERWAITTDKNDLKKLREIGFDKLAGIDRRTA